MKMPDKVKVTALKPGYYSISAEVLPQYAGDNMILSKYSDSDTAFQQTETHKNIPAVKNYHVFEMNGRAHPSAILSPWISNWVSLKSHS